MDNNQGKFNRRSFLGGGLATGLTALVPPPVERLLDIMSNSIIYKAHAESTGNLGVRNYVNIFLPGGPQRYAFDHWIRTNPNDGGLVYNPVVATALVSSGGKVTGTQYKTFDYKGLLVPHMFSHSVMGGKGELRPLTNILDNMLVIRGYASGLDGHQFNAKAQMGPVGGVSTVAGTAADYSTKIFQAIQAPNRGDYSNFFSSQGKAINTINSPKPAHALLDGFTPLPGGSANTRSLLQRNSQAIDTAKSKLQSAIRSERPGSSIVSQNFTSATIMMKKGMGDLDAFWAEALPRYTNVIRNSMRMTNLDGINDAALVSDNTGNWRFSIDGNGADIYHIGDLRDTWAARELAGNMAENFALTEYVLSQNLATSIELMINDQGAFKMNVGGVNMMTTVGHDMHFIGSISGTLSTVSFFRGLCAAILELSEKLKVIKSDGGNVWADTVVQISGDFARSARSDGFGSDHGFNQMVTSVISGAISSPLVVGNVYRNSKSSSYAGSQGVAAPIDGYNQSGKPSPAMAASTVAAVLRVPKNPYKNIAAPLVQEKNGVVSTLADAKVVEGS